MDWISHSREVLEATGHIPVEVTEPVVAAPDAEAAKPTIKRTASRKN